MMNHPGHHGSIHERENIMSVSTLEKFAFTFAAGAITGAVLALLYTPITGKKLQRKVSDVADRVADKVEDIQDSVRKIARG